MRRLRFPLSVVLGAMAAAGCEAPPPDDCTPDAPPQALVAKARADRVDLAWTCGATDVEYFRAERQGPDGTWGRLSGDVRPGLLFYSDYVVAPDRAYRYRVVAVRGACATAPSNEAEAFTFPNAPGAPTAAALASSSMVVRWDAAANDLEAGYRVDRRADGATDWERIADTGVLGPQADAYTDTGLDSNREYEYRVSAVSRAGDASAPRTARGWTLPLAPTGLQATAVSTSRIDLDWEDPAGQKTGYEVLRCAGDLAGCGDAGADAWTPVELETAGATACPVLQLAPGSQHSFRVHARNAGGLSLPAQITGFALPDAVSDLSAEARSTGSIALAWRDAPYPQATVSVGRQGAGGAYAEIGTVSVGTGAYLDAELEADAPYRYRLRVLNPGGASAPADLLAYTLPLPPGNFAATPASARAIDLKWLDSNDTETGYRIELCAGALVACEGTDAAWTLIAELPDGATEASATGLAPGAAYSFRADAANPGGRSALAFAQGHTLAVSPGSLRTSALSTSAIRLSWTDANTLPASFAVRRSPAGAGAWQTVAELGPAADAHTDTGLAPDTHYDYEVRVTTAGGATAAATVDGWTLPAAPAAFAVARSWPDGLDLAWMDTNAHETGLRLERRRQGEQAPVVVRELPADSSSDRDSGLEGGTAYAYRLFAIGPGGLSAPAEAGDRTTRAPVLAWGAAPSLDDSCRLTLGGTAVLDGEKNAQFASASGAIARAAGAVDAGTDGIAGTLTDFAAGSFAARWTVVDTLGASASLSRALRLAYVSPLATTGPARPQPAPGEDAMAGRQVWFPSREGDLPPLPSGCSRCGGRRGSLAVGTAFTCALTPEAQLRCWGANNFGQLGDGTLANRATPAPVCASGTGATCVPLEDVVAVSGAFRHVCALLGNGEIWCWGANANGQLGDGTTADSTRPVPVCASGSGASCTRLAGAVAVTAGWFQTCAVLATGEARCWGWNASGQIGDGLSTTTNRLLPATVCAQGSGDSCEALTDVADVEAGDWHTCALLRNGQIRCWGRNDLGQLGDGSYAQNRWNPATVCATGSATTCVPLADATSLAAGMFFSCAVLAGGTVQCWGRGGQGQLGDGTLAPGRRNPAVVCESGTGASCVPLAGAVAVAAGSAPNNEGHACALLSNGEARCWGTNDHGDLGDGTFTSPRSVAVRACASGWGATCSPQGGAVALGAGYLSSCVLLRKGELRCWGDNQAGQAGDGTSGNDKPNPTAPCAAGAGPTCVPFEAAVRACGAVAVTAP